MDLPEKPSESGLPRDQALITNITVPDLEPSPSEDELLAAISRFHTLLYERARIDREVREFRKRFKGAKNRECLRCGHHWASYQLMPPRQCPMCHSRAWESEPDLSDRRNRSPADPARPSWQQRKLPRNPTPAQIERVVEAKAKDPEADAYWARRERSTIPPPPRFGESNET